LARRIVCIQLALIGEVRTDGVHMRALGQVVPVEHRHGRRRARADEVGARDVVRRAGASVDAERSRIRHQSVRTRGIAADDHDIADRANGMHRLHVRGGLDARAEDDEAGCIRVRQTPRGHTAHRGGPDRRELRPIDHRLRRLRHPVEQHVHRLGERQTALGVEFGQRHELDADPALPRRRHAEQGSRGRGERRP